MTTILETDFPDRRLDAYLEALASSSVAPGGGSAAGLTGALGCSLGQMVCNLTLDKGDEAEIRALHDTLGQMKANLLDLAQQDEQVFSRYRKATALPRSTEDEKATRRSAIEDALVVAADVPLRMVGIGLEAIEILRRVGATGSKYALGDVSTGAYLVQAMTNGCLVNVDANIELMKAPKNIDHFSAASASARDDLTQAMSDLDTTLASRSQ
ncbi:MAG: cyclodeaminase/cyclohydrolase family protein [Thermomicrobiales bacterium]|nr:cyclodeaminase/cyclohydrolase family protein [Thermomicrobiales bacterium]MCO5222361.1 cyclodeaminase/cyclohydrolase family protein [Thermomicrobiales bacterium]